MMSIRARGIIGTRRFQSLIGRLKTTVCVECADGVAVFQSLIGRLKTKRCPVRVGVIGSCFNPS